MRRRFDTDKRRRQCDQRDSEGSDAGKARECQQSLEPGRGKEQIQGEHSPAGTLILDQ